MPEEVNRSIIDSIAELLFTTEPSATDNLAKEGVPATRIHFGGNTMIDTLMAQPPRIREVALSAQLGLESKRFIVVTLHRPPNVDDPTSLGRIVDMLTDESSDYGIRIGAMTGILAIALQEISDFSLQMPGNAVLFVVLLALVVRQAKSRTTHADGRRVRIGRSVESSLQGRVTPDGRTRTNQRGVRDRKIRRHQTVPAYRTQRCGRKSRQSGLRTCATRRLFGPPRPTRSTASIGASP